MKISPGNANATVIVFASTLCPISDKYVERLNQLYRRYSGRSVQFAAASPNSNESQEDVWAYAERNGIRYPFYKDNANTVADRVGARSTPEAFVFDRTGRLRYRGRIDDAVNPARVRSRSLMDAIDAVVNGQPVAVAETAARGCAIHRVRK